MSRPRSGTRSARRSRGRRGRTRASLERRSTANVAAREIEADQRLALALGSAEAGGEAVADLQRRAVEQYGVAIVAKAPLGIEPPEVRAAALLVEADDARRRPRSRRSTGRRPIAARRTPPPSACSGSILPARSRYRFHQPLRSRDEVQLAGRRPRPAGRSIPLAAGDVRGRRRAGRRHRASPSHRSVPSHGMRGWSQLSQASRRPSGDRRGSRRSRGRSPSTVSAPEPRSIATSVLTASPAPASGPRAPRSGGRARASSDRIGVAHRAVAASRAAAPRRARTR